MFNRKFFKKLIWFLMLFSGAAVMIVSSAFVGAEPGAKLRSAAFYIENIISIFGLTLTIFGVVFMNIDEYKLKNEEYTFAYSQIMLFIKEEYRPTVWTKFIRLFNRKRLINQFIFDTKLELHNLEINADVNDQILYEEKGRDKEKKENEYCKQRSFLELKLTEEWIEKNVDKVSVNFDQVNIDTVVSGYFPKAKGRQLVNDYVTKNKELKIAKDRMPSLLITSGVFMLISSFIISFEFNATVYTLFLIKLFAILWNIYISIRYAEDFNKEVTLKDIMFQYGVVLEYRAYVKKELGQGSEENVVND